MFHQLVSQESRVALACLAMDVLGHLTSRSIEKTLNQASLTGRMSKHVIGGRNYILDVGHNALACKFVTQSLEAVIPRRQRIVIFGALQDKDVNRMLPVLKGFTDRVVLVGIEGEQVDPFTRLRNRGRHFLNRRVGGVLLHFRSR